MVFFVVLLVLFFVGNGADAQVKIPPAFRVARLKYSGGGDWYNDASAVPNLMRYLKEKTGIATPDKEEIVEAASSAIFQYAVVFMTGHGNVRFTDAELNNLRAYLKAGGFIYVDDDYGMDKSFRREAKRLFSGVDLVELPYSHALFNVFFSFPTGAPKIHEHDNQPPQTFGLFHNSRLVLLYTYESNPSDGWANPEIHNDSPEMREKALQFGANIFLYALTK